MALMNEILVARNAFCRHLDKLRGRQVCNEERDTLGDKLTSRTRLLRVSCLLLQRWWGVRSRSGRPSSADRHCPRRAPVVRTRSRAGPGLRSAFVECTLTPGNGRRVHTHAVAASARTDAHPPSKPPSGATVWKTPNLMPDRRPYHRTITADAQLAKSSLICQEVHRFDSSWSTPGSVGMTVHVRAVRGT